MRESCGEDEKEKCSTEQYEVPKQGSMATEKE